MSTQDFVASLVDKFAELVVEKIYAQHGWNGEKFEALEARMDRLDKLVEDTLNKSPVLFENLSDRLQKLEDKFDHLNGVSDDRLDEYFQNSDVVCSLIENKIDTALENYDPEDHIDFEDMLNNSFAFDDKVKDAVRDLEIVVTVR